MPRTALLYATVTAADGGPAALLGDDAETALGRLLDQLSRLAFGAVRVVARPEDVDAVRAAATGAAVEVSVVASDDRAEDLRLAADVAARGGGDLLVGPADAVTHREALAGLVADPRIVSGGLTTSSTQPGRRAFRIRATGGRIVSATSWHHRVAKPNGFFLGFLKIGERDRDAAAAAARRLADLLGDPPPAWREAPERHAADWRALLVHEAGADRTGRQEGLLGWTGDAVIDDELALRARIAGEDVPSVWLVGLLRGGVSVAGSNLRKFGFARPMSRAEVRTALERVRLVDEDRVALDSAVKAADGFFTTFFVSPYSKYIARFCARRGWTPNQVTVVSFALGVVAALVFAAGSRAALIAGAVLLQVSFTVDCVDGQLARYTRTFSQLGAWLDSVFDRSKEFLVFAGLAYGSAHALGDDVWTLAAAALLLQTVRHMVGFAYSAQPGVTTPMRPPPVEDLDDALADGGSPVARPAAPGGGAAPVARPGRAGVGDIRRAPVAAVTALGRGAIRVANSLDPYASARWLRRIVVLPIGERFALISLTAAVFTPRVTFVSLLAWGTFALLYTGVGRVLRSLAR